jgi:hypothetical protein
VADLEAQIASLKVNVVQHGQLMSDHEQRFDTLQTKPWRRFWFWFWEGWPLWSDLNAEKPSRRLWR